MKIVGHTLPTSKKNSNHTKKLQTQNGKNFKRNTIINTLSFKITIQSSSITTYAVSTFLRG